MSDSATTSLALSSTEAGALARCEKAIRDNADGIAGALREIRDGRLYRETHDTFEDYCKEKWGMRRAYADKQISHAKVLENLNPIGFDSLPANEAQARPLARLAPDQQAGAWTHAVETAPEGKITAAHVERVVREIEGRADADTAPEFTPDVQPPAPDAPAPVIEVVGPVAPEPDPEPEPAYTLPDDGGCTVDDLSTLISAGKRFACVYADPPWQYGNQATRAATDRHYPTMPLDEICALPVGDLAADDAHLHIWTTNGFLFDTKRVIEAWGFEYRSVLVWVKPQMGIGNYWRVSHEFLVTAIRGDATRFLNRSQMSWFQADRTKHSAKPPEARRKIELVSAGPRIELFGRQAAAGWTVWGNQISRSMFEPEAEAV